MDRLMEGSSWAGIAAAAQMAASFLPPSWAVWLHGVTAFAAAVAVKMPDKGSAPLAPPVVAGN